MDIARCISCDGYGWHQDEEGQTTDCDWCGGIGYVYRSSDGVDSRIPPADYGRVADQLEQLDQQRLRELGYRGAAKRPWEQDIRKGTKGGQKPTAPYD